ncbi:nuclear transport factor 2 family protein [Dyella ginsengisoli]|jgi:hypothetical protein
MRKSQRVVWCAACFVALSMFGSGTMAAPSTMDETTHDAAAVIATDDHWLQAEVSGDTAYLAQLLLPSYRSVSPDGSVHPRAAILAHAAKNRGSDQARRQVEAWRKTHPSHPSVVIQGDTAVLSFQAGDAATPGVVRSSDIFVYVDGHWRALYSQHSAVPTK